MTHLAKTHIAAAVALLAPALAAANPSGGQVVSGTVTIGGQGGRMVVTQTSNSAIVNWQDFSVGADESVRFDLPSASAAILNRVTGTAASNIAGSISSNGRVFLVNPNGIVFGQGAQINVGSLIATTLDISDADFNAGRYKFQQGSGMPGSIVNNGSIVADGGNVMLLADQVHNGGLIQANYGRVALHAGASMTLSFDEQGLINYEVADNDALLAARSQNAGVSNSGELRADGGTVYMTAVVARALIKTVVNNSGTISATRMESGEDGAIVLYGAGGDVEISGDINGGYVYVGSSHDVAKTAGASLQLYADALSVTAGDSIALASDGTEGSNSYLGIGDGIAIGYDADLLAQIERFAAAHPDLPNLMPRSYGPNAGFEAGGSVALGDVYLGGGYLYVRAASVSAQHIATEGSFFYNYRPTGDTSNIDLVQSLNLPISASSVTLAYGGGGYSGDINISGPQAPALTASGDAANYLFMTNGKINGAGQLSTSGVVAVLAGTAGPGPGTPGEPTAEDEATAETVATITTGLAQTVTVHDLQPALPPGSEPALVSEESQATQCQ
ncbi:two-partner secretion domain-containing protein [Solimonas variicoloris]|uniref:two-partner secretion domain-containing protein n=1 Tax=Solimonas variicoloris TaxID=254408 RepID=UPI00035E2AB1|nr:filamentous hemagglutinin N-terminal domain-containing protein [Solimonas variicoloris]